MGEEFGLKNSTENSIKNKSNVHWSGKRAQKRI